MENALVLQRHILGTAGLGGVWGEIDHRESIVTILQALESGFTAIDTAPAYGDGELMVGKALTQWNGPRPQISTKIGRLRSYSSDKGIYNYTPDAMAKSMEHSLKALGVTYVDILFLHEPDAVPVEEIEPAVEKMIEFKRQGYACKIGLGGIAPPAFQEYISADVFDVVMEYNRLDGCSIEALSSTLPSYTEKGISYWAASPLHMGLLGSRFQSFVENPPEWLPQSDIDRAIYINEIAGDNNLSLSSLALRFLQNVAYPIKIVIGPANQKEFNDCLSSILNGPLEMDIYSSITNYLKK